MVYLSDNSDICRPLFWFHLQHLFGGNCSDSTETPIPIHSFGILSILHDGTANWVRPLTSVQGMTLHAGNHWNYAIFLDWDKGKYTWAVISCHTEDIQVESFAFIYD